MRKAFLLGSLFFIASVATADMRVSNVWMVPDNSVLSSGFLKPTDNWLNITSRMSLSVYATADIDGSTSQPPHVVVSVSALEDTGGHEHSNPPSGAFSPNSGVMSLVVRKPNTARYRFNTTYTAPENAGQFKITATAGGRMKTKLLTVGIPNLVALYPLSTTTYRRIGVRPGSTHPNNVYATSRVITALKEVAEGWHNYWNDDEQVPPAERDRYDSEVGRLQINDCSLVWGGLFDYRSTWAHPHKTHRKGLETDIRLDRSANDGGIPRTYMDKLTELAQDAYSNNTRVEIHNNNHFHIYWR